MDVLAAAALDTLQTSGGIRVPIRDQERAARHRLSWAARPARGVHITSTQRSRTFFEKLSQSAEMAAKLIVQRIAVQKRDDRQNRVVDRLALTTASKLVVMGEAVRSPPLADAGRAGEVLEHRLGHVARGIVAAQTVVLIERGKERALATLLLAPLVLRAGPVLAVPILVVQRLRFGIGKIRCRDPVLVHR